MLSRLISKDIDEHINNISSCHLYFFEIFSSSQHCYSKDIQASFEKAFWRLDPLVKDSKKKDLASATLPSIALNYIAKKGPNPPKALQRALNNIKRRDDIIISKPDKGSGVVVMDRDQYLRLLSEASINDSTKFAHIDQHRPKTRGRPPKHVHPLIEKEKQLHERVHKILPKATAEQLCPKGSRHAHLYGLPKTRTQRKTVHETHLISLWHLQLPAGKMAG